MVLLANDDGVAAFRDEFVQCSMRPGHQRAHRVVDLAARAAELFLNSIGRAMRGEDDDVGMHRADISSALRSRGFHLGNDVGIVD